MTPNDSELLRSYVRDGSETAFGELVRRHVGLVYAAALRQLDGDAAAAEDATQLVFTDLVRKAGDLTGHPSLAGWLHTSARHVTAKTRRGEQRRLAREHTAHAMNLPPDDDDALWGEARPLLDDALHELPEPDREAVLLRFFEKLSLGEVGSRLGVGEDAARKRVDRALDKLRGLLVARGVTSTSTAALAVLLQAQASAAEPAGLCGQVTSAALRGAPSAGTASATVAGAGWLAWFLGWPAKVAPLAGIAAIVASVAVQLRPHGDTPQPVAVVTAGTTVPGPSVPAPIVPSDSTSVAAVAEEDTAEQLSLLLHLVEARTGRPVVSGRIEFRGWKGREFIGKTYHSDTNGHARVHYPIGVTDLELTTRIDGLADTRLKWTPENGEIIPLEHVLRLVTGTPIGGIVVDQQGRPVAGAKVGFSQYDDPGNYKGPESHEFAWIEVETGTDGRWRIDRVAPGVLHRIHGGAKHPDHGPSEYLSVERIPEHLAMLKALTHEFVLQDGIVVTGIVVDSEGEPMSDAAILVGTVGDTSSRTGRSDGEGRFRVAGNKPGPSFVTAMVEGFSPSTEEVELVVGMSPVRLTLTPGGTLRLKAVDTAGKPVPKANFAYDTFRRGPADSQVQARFARRADQNGQLVWSNAPSGRLRFHVRAEGYLEKDGWTVEADDTEHVVTLTPALRLRGDVRDGATGELIPEFRLSLGWAETDFSTGRTNARFSKIDRFHSTHVGGRFDKHLEEPPIGGMAQVYCMARVEAAGYVPFTSRPIALDEGDVSLRVELRPVREQAVTFLNPDGTPASQTEVAVIRPESRFVLKPGGFDSRMSTEHARRTDGNGQISLSIDDDALRVVVAGTEGYGEFAPAEVVAGGALRLGAWGRVEGLIVAKGKPVPQGHATLQRAGIPPLRPAPFTASFGGFNTPADADGRFVIPMVPPGEWLLLPVTVTKTGPTSSSSSPGNPERFTIPAGQTLDVVLGASGTRVIARPVSATGEPLSVDPATGMFGFVGTAGTVAPKELWGDRERLMAWHQRPEMQAILRKSHICAPENGQLVAEDVQPGDYVFQVTFSPMSRTAEGQLIMEPNTKPHAIAQVRFTVPDPAPPEGIDLGEIRLEPLAP